MKAQTVDIGLWVANMGLSPQSLEGWAQTVRGQLERAKAEGMDILMMPEYISEQWMSFAPAMHPSREIEWMAGQAVPALPLLQKAVDKTGVALLAGSMPAPAEGGGFVNRATMLFPDRGPIHHDKLVLTPFEQDPGDWNLETGKTVRVFEWRGMRIAIIICLDVEMPSLSNRLAEHHVDLLLVPSMTGKLSGYNRVFGCAKARAVELMTVVAAVGCVDAAVQGGIRREGHAGAAAVYLPCEEIFGFDGIHAALPVLETQTGAGEVLYARDIPVGAVRDLRRGKPEVWPGPWSAAHIDIVDPV